MHFKCLHGTVHPRRIELKDATLRMCAWILLRIIGENRRMMLVDLKRLFGLWVEQSEIPEEYRRLL